MESTETTTIANVDYNTLPKGTVLEYHPLGRQDTIQAKVDGQNVTIIGEGNVVGMSPAWLCVGPDLVAKWYPFPQVRITDPTFLPRPYSIGQ